jgi:uncharacterized protein YidB (DUF937 family)
VRRRGKVTPEVTTIIAREALLRIQSKTIKEIAHETGLDRNTVQTHLSRWMTHYRQKAVSHGTS